MRWTALALASVFVLAVAAGTGAANQAPGSAPGSIRAAAVKRVCTSSLGMWANCGAQVVADANGSPLAGSHRRRPRSGLRSSTRPTTCRRPRRWPGRSRSSTPTTIPSIAADLAAYSTYYNLPPCTTANGCFRKVNQIGGHDASGGERRLGARDRARRRDRACRLPELQDPPRRGELGSISDLGKAENEAVALGANAISNSWGAQRVLGGDPDERNYFHHPGVAITASTGDNGYGRSFRRPRSTSPRSAARRCRSRADGSYSGETAWDGAGSGLLLATSRSRRGRPTPAASGARSATCPRSRTRAPAPRSSTRCPTAARPAGSRSAGRASPAPLIAATYLLAGNTGAVNNAVGPLRQRLAPARHHLRQQRLLHGGLSLHRTRRLRRADRPGHAERRRRLRGGLPRCLRRPSHTRPSGWRTSRSPPRSAPGPGDSSAAAGYASIRSARSRYSTACRSPSRPHAWDDGPAPACPAPESIGSRHRTRCSVNVPRRRIGFEPAGNST